MSEKEVTNFNIGSKGTTIGDAFIVIFVITGFFIPWIVGVILAQGAWMKVVGVFFFPYAWYLTYERVLQLVGFIPQSCL